MAVPDVVLLRKVGQARHDFVALRHPDPVRPAALAQVGHLHAGRETFPRTSTSRDVSFRSRWLGVACAADCGALAIVTGIGNVTFPVAAHSAPRANVVTNAAVCTCSTSCPNAVTKTRPLP